MSHMRIQNTALIDGMVPSDLAATKTIEIFRCKDLYSIELPESLETFTIFGDLPQAGFPVLPDSLTSFHIEKCHSFSTLPHIPDNVTRLNVIDCPNFNFNASDTFPPGLSHLNIYFGTGVTHLPTPPPTLKSLYLKGSLLEELPPLPIGLEDLDLSDCNSLVITQDLLNQIVLLETNGCNIDLPDYIYTALDERELELEGEFIEDPEDVETDRIRLTIGSIAHLTHDHPDLVSALSRYMLENQLERGGAESLVDDLTSLIDFIIATPSCHTLFNNIASHYLEGCVNQPVAAVGEIYAWKAIIEAEGIENKIAAGRQVMVLEVLKAFATEHSPGGQVEVEASNALLTRVYAMLVSEDSTLKWQGIPNRIAYEDTVSSWLTEDKIHAAYLKAKEIMDKPQIDIAIYLCEHSNIWPYAAFPIIVPEIEERYFPEKEKLRELMENTDLPLPDEYKPKRADGSTDHTPLTADASCEHLGELYTALEVRMLEEIHATVKNLTIAALRDTAEMPPPSRTITTASSIHPDFIGREAEEHTVIPDVTPALIRSHSAREKDFPPTTPALGRSRSME